MGTPDVICLQEVSRGLSLGGEDAPDQVEELGLLFPGYEVLFGAAIDALANSEGARWQFGNAVLTRLPLLSVQHHILPRPADDQVKHMTRQASEIVVESACGTLRIVNLHLEYHSLIQRKSQIDTLRHLQSEAIAERIAPPKVDPDGAYQAISRPVDSVYCGDYNMLVDSEEYRLMLSPLSGVSQPFRDAWGLAYPGRPHPPTCGIFDHASWPEGPHCRDFFFVAGGCTEQVTEVSVDTRTDASDHQPLLLSLNR
jgi:endonuclease/exonuclease/phosphatase family metal-dependent hydrolase